MNKQLLEQFESEYRILFSRSKRPETLLIMVRGQARKWNLHFDESVESYSRAARSYRHLGNARATAMFTAAEDRLQRLADKGVKLSEFSLVG